MMDRIWWLIAVLSAVVVWNSYGGEVERIEEEIAAAEESGFGAVVVHGTMTDWAELEESGGDVRYSGFGIMANVLIFNFGYSQKRFDWENVDKIPFGDGKTDPWGDLYEINFGLGYGGPVTEKWSWFGDVGVFSAHEQDMDGSYGYYAAAGAGYSLNENWSVTIGAAGAGYRKVQTKWSMFPMLGIGWREEATDGFSVLLGYPESQVSWHICERSAVSLYFSEDGTVYRLDDDSVVAPEGYMETDFAVVGLSVDYSFTDAVALAVSVDTVVDGTLQMYDSDGDKLERYDVGDTVRGMVSVVWGF